jgi:hypothetical protein
VRLGQCPGGPHGGSAGARPRSPGSCVLLQLSSPNSPRPMLRALFGIPDVPLLLTVELSRRGTGQEGTPRGELLTPRSDGGVPHPRRPRDATTGRSLCQLRSHSRRNLLTCAARGGTSSRAAQVLRKDQDRIQQTWAITAEVARNSTSSVSADGLPCSAAVVLCKRASRQRFAAIGSSVRRQH